MRKEITIFVGGLFAGMLLMFLLGRSFVPPNPKATTFKLQGPDNYGVELHIEGDGIDYKKIFETIFSESFFRNGALGWLAEKQRVFFINDGRLISAISSICEPFPDQPIDKKIKSKRECAEKIVVKGLRDLAFDRKPPFHYVGNLGHMGIPLIARNRPPAGIANVCKPGDYWGKKLQVGNPLNKEVVVEVQASGSYPCTDASNFPDIQLSPEDASKLFPNASLGKTESVIVVPIE